MTTSNGRAAADGTEVSVDVILVCTSAGANPVAHLPRLGPEERSLAVAQATHDQILQNLRGSIESGQYSFLALLVLPPLNVVLHEDMFCVQCFTDCRFAHCQFLHFFIV